MVLDEDTSRSLLESVNKIVRDAGDAILEVYSSADFGVEVKGDDSPLTRADKAAHNVIVDALKGLNVGPVLSEEDADIPWDTRKEWSIYWLVDPLDGTKEFIKRNGEFTVNIALICNGEPVLGSVYAPDKSLLFYGAKDVGAFRQVDNGEIESITVDEVPSENGLWRIVGSRSHQSEEFQAFVKQFESSDIVSMGSSLKLCLVADGSADLYPRLGLTSEWDTAAAQAVVEAAGGQVFNWETLQPLRYNTKDSVLNPFFIVCSQPSKLWYRKD